MAQPTCVPGAGVSPGNHQSAEKRRHSRTNKGNKPLKYMPPQCAKAVREAKISYFYARYQCIAVRQGNNRAPSLWSIPFSQYSGMSAFHLPQALHNGAAVNRTVHQQRDQDPQDQKQRYDR
ncbi:MAG: transposase [Oscillospiraceae bacterium]|nr:transposase [Oscillospiraceae bacterium]